jgi:predicted molibdopterin-dependent oxidoreductase YjgC
VKIFVNGKEYEVDQNNTILTALSEVGIYIPSICYHPKLPTFEHASPASSVFVAEDKVDHQDEGGGYSGCGLCLVKVDDGALVLACNSKVKEGIRIYTDTDDVIEGRRINLRKILEKHPHYCMFCQYREGCSLTVCSQNTPEDERCCPLIHSCELIDVANYIGQPSEIGRYTKRGLPVVTYEKNIVFDYNLCIDCLRCVRACEHIAGASAISYVISDGALFIGPKGPNLTESGCKFCMLCVVMCPTGAIRITDENWIKKKMSGPLPPEEYSYFDEENIEGVPEAEGVITLLDEFKRVIYIKGADNIREALKDKLSLKDRVKYFKYEISKMYTMRESEELQAYIQKWRRMPQLNEEEVMEDDLFD